jgi:hypothetical protein
MAKCCKIRLLFVDEGKKFYCIDTEIEIKNYSWSCLVDYSTEINDKRSSCWMLQGMLLYERDAKGIYIIHLYKKCTKSTLITIGAII